MLVTKFFSAENQLIYLRAFSPSTPCAIGVTVRAAKQKSHRAMNGDLRPASAHQVTSTTAS
jgi:hypothetical protein